LSATVSNAEEFADWLVTVRGHTKVVVTEQRPVPLWQHMLVGRRLLDLSDGEEVDPELTAAIREQERRVAPGPPRGRRGYGRPRRPRPPDRVDVVDRLDREGLLPAIVFIFSRAGCAAAVAHCVAAGLGLTTTEERAAIRQVIELRTADLPAEDLAVLGFWEWREALEHGIAAHHAGLIPAFKETVEELFVRGLVKVVYATETLALGINMPARSVVLERLVKYNGESHADLTAGEYTQLTGRAGRRGIDIEGHAVVVWSDGLDPAAVARLASKRLYPLNSSFRPSYNMAVNLVGQIGRAGARELLESSFAQFQADRAVVGLARTIARNEEALAGYAEAMSCHLGDFVEYAGMRRALTDRERSLAREGAAARRAAAAESLEQLKVGDVIRVPAGRRAGVAVVVDLGRGNGLGPPAPTVLTMDRRIHRISAIDVPTPVEQLGRLRIPAAFQIRSPRSRRDLASSLRNLDLPETRRGARRPRGDDEEIAALRAKLRQHPCHGCADREEHARWAERHHQLAGKTERLRRQVQQRTNSLGRTFDQICTLLTDRGFLDGEQATADGQQLARIWSETDLLVAECLRSGIWKGLDAPALAAIVSTLIYESRQGDRSSPRVPNAISDALSATTRLWVELAGQEEEHGLRTTREPDLGFAWPAYRWARGERLEAALESAGLDEQLTAGDFVRWCKQVIDALDQISGVAGGQLAAQARLAVAAIRRGVVAT
jgi:ATP-dependent RNA helicase HelY